MPKLREEKAPRQFNVVFYFKVNLRANFPPPHFNELDVSITKYHNFVILRQEKVTFTVFVKSGHVNSSGTETFAHIQNTLSLANKLFDASLTETDVTISSSTWAGRFSHTLLNIPSTRKALTASDINTRVSLRPSRFPGAVVRRLQCPTVIVFRNGKYIIIGAKSADIVTETAERIRSDLRCLCC
jgi:TATA-box binding protein (TBP) (component of TFIID and TFIIIB)